MINMPDFLRSYLENLPADKKNELWDWLDDYPHCVSDMIEVVGQENGEHW